MTVTFRSTWLPGIGIRWQFTRGDRTANLTTSFNGRHVTCVLLPRGGAFIPERPTSEHDGAPAADTLARIREWLGVEPVAFLSGDDVAERMMLL